MRRNPVAWLAGLLALLLVIGWGVWMSGPPLSAPEEKSGQRESAPTMSPSSPVETAVPSSRSDSATAPGSALELPDPDAYRKQAKEDPHHVPRVVTAFARQLAPRMEAALESRAEAEALFPDLERCANGPRTVESVRAICAVNAGRLAQRHPDALSARYQALRSGLPDGVAESLEASGY